MNSTSTVSAAAMPPVDLQTQALATSRPMALNGRKPMSMAKIDAASKDFEAQFLSEMLENMFSTIDPKDSFGGSDEEGTYRSMMVNEYGKAISRAGGIGIAAQVKSEMLKMQEKSA